MPKVCPRLIALRVAVVSIGAAHGVLFPPRVIARSVERLEARVAGISLAHRLFIRQVLDPKGAMLPTLEQTVMRNVDRYTVVVLGILVQIVVRYAVPFRHIVQDGRPHSIHEPHRGPWFHGVATAAS